MIHYHTKGERRKGRRRIVNAGHMEPGGIDYDKRKTPRRKGKRFSPENWNKHVHNNGHRRNRFKSSKQRKHATKIKLGVQ